jgi:hypothetical protein
LGRAFFKLPKCCPYGHEVLSIRSQSAADFHEGLLFEVIFARASFQDTSLPVPKSSAAVFLQKAVDWN